LARGWKRCVTLTPLLMAFNSRALTPLQSAGSLASFLLACAKFGDTFIPRAQAELDRVVGSHRLPTFDDLESLEYLRAIVAETLRWRPVAVLGGTPHATTADDVYKGMFIPKGSTVIAPLWSSKSAYWVCFTVPLTDMPQSTLTKKTSPNPMSSDRSASWERETTRATSATAPLAGGGGSAPGCTLVQHQWLSISPGSCGRSMLAQAGMTRARRLMSTCELFPHWLPTKEMLTI